MSHFTRFLTGMVLVLTLSFSVGAAQVVDEETPLPANRCGDDLIWELKDGTLTVAGSGPMYDFPEGAPWAGSKGEIRALKLEGSVTTIGAGAFQDYDSLTSLDLGGSLTQVGEKGFSSCDGLTKVSLPRGFRVFGEESFSHCSNLKEFRFEGGMPSFKLNCLWGTEAKLIYPEANPWPLVHIEQLEQAFQGRIEFLSSDGTDPIQSEQVQAEETPTVAPTQAPTQAPTEAPTIPATEPTVTEAVTVPETQPTEATETEETLPLVPELPEEPEFVELPEPESSMGIGMIILIVVMAVSGIALLVMAGVMLRGRNRLTEEDFPDPSMEIRPKGKPTQAQKEAEKKSRRDR